MIKPEMLHTGTVPFETPRLICRRFEMSDRDDMLAGWASEPETQTEYGEPVYTGIRQVESLLGKYIEGYRSDDFYRWAIVEKASGSNIGQIAFCRVYSDIRTAEIEYCIGKHYRGNGYAGEALGGLIRFIFANTEFVKLEAYHRAENKSSGRVLEGSVMHITDNVERFVREGVTPDGEICYCVERGRYRGSARQTRFRA